ncbi:MAG: hypothetical protein P1U89_18880 [Verrucomicrobiales bacterium]|nr:hypothetical protein [Verrucomicrobiales bacterium]
MKIYLAIQILRFLLMCCSSPSGGEGASQTCEACRGEKGIKIVKSVTLEKKSAFLILA